MNLVPNYRKKTAYASCEYVFNMNRGTLTLLNTRPWHSESNIPFNNGTSMISFSTKISDKLFAMPKTANVYLFPSLQFC